MWRAFAFHGKCRGLNIDWSVSIACNTLPLEKFMFCFCDSCSWVHPRTQSVTNSITRTYADRQFLIYTSVRWTHQLGFYCLLVYLFLLIACFVFNKNYVLFYIVIVLLQFTCRMRSLCTWSYYARVSNVAPIQYSNNNNNNNNNNYYYYYINVSSHRPCLPVLIIIIIIIIIIVIIISFMQGIFTYIPETNYVPKECSVAAILLLLFMALI